jgi:hypothetical protein
MLLAGAARRIASAQLFFRSRAGIERWASKAVRRRNDAGTALSALVVCRVAFLFISILGRMPRWLASATKAREPRRRIV